MKSYGKELILDLHECDDTTFNRESIKGYFDEVCRLIDMTQCELYFWDDLETAEDEKQTSPHTKGTSAIQFILTSNITIHTLELLNSVYLNIFSCKEFDPDIAINFSKEWFKGEVVNVHIIERK